LSASVLADSRVFLLILVLGAVAIVAIMAIAVSHRLQWDALSPLGLIAAFFVTTFVFGAVYAYVTPWPSGPQPYQPGNIVQAVGLAALGLPMLVLGYWTNAFRGLLRAIPRLPARAAVDMPVTLLLFLLAVGWAARLYLIGSGRYFWLDDGRGIATGASWLMGVLGALPLVATAYLGSAYYMAKRAGGPYRREQWGFYLLLLIEIAYNAPTGSRASVLTIITMVVVLRYYGLRRRPSALGLTALVLVAVLVVFPFFVAYRNAGETGTAFQEDLGASLTTSAQPLIDQSPRQAWDAGASATLERFAGAAMVASMLHQGTDAIQRKRGETLSWSLTGLLPRAIAPNKPDPGAFANEFGQSLSITAPGDLRSSVTVTPLAELYFNYRLVGIIIGMFLIGGVYRVLGDYFIARKTEIVSLAIYAASAWPLINAQEAIIAGGLIGTLKRMAVLAIVLVIGVRIQDMASRGASKSAPALS
jgi:hypothetical protein